MSTHGSQEITDPVEEMLKKTGCMELHFKVQECIAETQDWRKCQNQVKDFKKCMLKYQERRFKEVAILRSIFERIKPVEFARTKMVFLVRTDLKTERAKIASQIAHAAVLLYKESIRNKNPFLHTWLRWGQPKNVLKVEKNCQRAMREAYENAYRNGLTVCRVLDNGNAQIDSGNLTVVGIGPNKIEDIDKVTTHFKLL